MPRSRFMPATPSAAALGRAWGEELDRVRSGWWTYAIHLTRDPHRAEDLIQEALLRVLRQQVSPGEVAPGYFFRVMRNAWISDGRRITPRPMHARSEGAEDEVDEHSGELVAALAMLSEPQQEVVTLKHGAGLTLEQIALATGRPLGTVAGQYRRGLGVLRSALASEIRS
ncbi:MAG: sigma-70 family RNA polymerase sigma factor [Phycisphaerales bacterium]|nr:sigma-70 family RNA polymerase sigma factor [Phycisphaerales bacterium]